MLKSKISGFKMAMEKRIPNLTTYQVTQIYMVKFNKVNLFAK
jgi:hypothetical protein